MSERFNIKYKLQSDQDSVEDLTQRIIIEQTIEMPENLVKDNWIRDNIIGEVIDCHQTDTKEFELLTSYQADITSHELPQFLNLLYGNISYLSGIKIIDINWPAEFLEQFQGPHFGVHGIRNLLSIPDRPLMATALKPLGSPPAVLADMCYQFASGGLDIIKDDHSLSNQSYCPFQQRVEACMHSIKRAENETGKATLYFPNVSGSVETIPSQIEQAISLGAGGVILAPFILGLDYTRHLIDQYRGQIAFMAHIAFGGSYVQDKGGLTPEILLGSLTRLVGFDAAIFPHYNGRFPFTKQDCQKITQNLQNSLGELKPAWSVPAGGIDFDHIQDEVHIYGNDVILLIGGSLYSYSSNLQEGAKHFLEKLEGLS